jgi:hypothetical protein
MEGSEMSKKDYQDLIQAYVENKISISEFEPKFNTLFCDDENIPENIVNLLYEFFTDLDCYDASHTEEEEIEDRHQVTEKTLRLKAKETLEKLAKI